MTTSRGRVAASTACATSTYFASPAAASKTPRQRAWAIPETPIANSTTAATAFHLDEGWFQRTATSDAVPMAIIGHAGSRNRKYRQASQGRYKRYESHTTAATPPSTGRQRQDAVVGHSRRDGTARQISPASKNGDSTVATHRT